jgi:hypothetical protein
VHDSPGRRPLQARASSQLPQVRLGLRMAEMSMNRVIHAAVCRDLGRFTSALSTLGDDERRIGRVSAAWANFRD